MEVRQVAADPARQEERAVGRGPQGEAELNTRDVPNGDSGSDKLPDVEGGGHEGRRGIAPGGTARRGGQGGQGGQEGLSKVQDQCQAASEPDPWAAASPAGQNNR